MKSLIYLFLALVFVLVLTGIVFAQGPPPPLMPGAPDQAPIDGGLTLLAAAGGGYAIKKLRDRKKAEAEAMDDVDV